MQRNQRPIILPAIPERQADEVIAAVQHEYGQSVSVVIATVCEGKKVAVRTVSIFGADYELLMGDGSPWDPNKPEGRWRDEDLFAMIDIIDGRQQ